MSDVPPPNDSPPPGASSGGVGSAGVPFKIDQNPAPIKIRYAPFLIAACAISISLSSYLWLKLSHIQETLARQSADSSAQSVEARTLARAAQELAQQTAARQASMDTRLSEVALQRGQLDELIQSLSRSRDENLVVDIESALRLAQQQVQLTGSLEPMLAALKSADQRLTRAAQPRLNPLQRALAKDLDRVKAASTADMLGLLIKLDELVRLVDDIPLSNKVGAPKQPEPSRKPLPSGKAPTSGTEDAIKTESVNPISQWVFGLWTTVKDEGRKLVRVSTIASPESVLLSPEQSFFVRENLKLRLLNARLGLLARQMDASRADLASVSVALDKYFDSNARSTQQASALVQQLQSQLRANELPRIDDTLAALATAAAGR